MNPPRQTPPDSRGRSAQFFILGNLTFGCLLAAGILNSFLLDGRLPKIRFGYVERHQHLIAANNLGAALPELRAAAAIDFDNAAAQLQFLSIAYEVNDAESVVFGLRGLLSHTPDDPELHGKLAIALFEIGQSDEALLHAEHAVRLDPANADLRTTQGAILLALGRFPEAAAIYRKALELNPSSESAHRALSNPLKNY